VLLRHAKSVQPTAAMPDADRPLSDRGRLDASAAGAWLADQNLTPDLVLCSPSRRTRETWQGVLAALGAAARPAVVYEPRLYASDADDLVDMLRDTEDDVGVLLVIGHNPTLSQASALLDPAGSRSAELRTSSLAVHTVPDGWASCGPGLAPLARAHTARG
jgi:phosphohistidine phosphatase